MNNLNLLFTQELYCKTTICCFQLSNYCRLVQYVIYSQYPHLESNINDGESLLTQWNWSVNNLDCTLNI